MSADDIRQDDVGLECCPITGSSALHSCKSSWKINRKMENSISTPPCKIITSDNFIFKLGKRDYVEDVTVSDVDRFNGGLSPNGWNITHLWLFPVLSCTVLSFVFSFQRRARTVRPIYSLYGSNDVVPPNDGPFGVMTVSDIISGNRKMLLPQKRGVNRCFHAKLAKY